MVSLIAILSRDRSLDLSAAERVWADSLQINCRNVGGYPYSARGPFGTLHFYSYMVDLVCAALISCPCVISVLVCLTLSQESVGGFYSNKLQIYAGVPP